MCSLRFVVLMVCDGVAGCLVLGLTPANRLTRVLLS